MQHLQTNLPTHKNLFIFLPLLCLILASWYLSPKISRGMSEDIRVYALLTTRICALALLAVTIAFVVPVKNRMLQLSITAITFLLLIVILSKIDPSNIISPVLCVIAATASTLALLPNTKNYSNIRHDKDKNIFEIFLAFSLPFTFIIFASVLILQISEFIEYSFTENIGNSIYSSLYAPIYMVLQTFGYNSALADIAIKNYSLDFKAAYMNAVTLTALVSTPFIIITRSFFTQNSTRLFLTFLAFIAIIGNSIGSCLSLVLLALLIMWPGTYFALMCTSLVLFIFSFYLKCDPFVPLQTLYNPDINLSMVDFSYGAYEKLLLILSCIAPAVIVIFTTYFKKDKDKRRRIQEGNAIGGFKINPKSPQDLQVLCILRALHGISNIKNISREKTLLKIAIVSTNKVHSYNLNLLTYKKVLFDRHHLIYTIDLDQRAFSIEQRLKKLIGYNSNFTAFKLSSSRLTKNTAQGV